MSAFIDRPGLQSLPTPYIVARSRTAGFAVPTAPGKIQQLLDATLNAAATPPGQPLVRRFVPLLDCLVLTFIHYPDVHAEQSGVPPGSQFGSFTYQECAVFLPLKDTMGNGPGTCWHVPFLQLNQGIPLILGREVYGMPKVFGRIDARPLQMDDWLENPTGVLKVSTEGFPQLGASLPLRFVDVAEAAIQSHLRLPRLDPLDLVGFASHGLESTAHVRAVFDFFQTLVEVGFPGIFLKQFPDCSGVHGGVYHRLLQAAFTPTAISSPTCVLAEVKVFDPASYPLASTFGLVPGVAKTTVGIVAEISWVLPPPTEL